MSLPPPAAVIFDWDNTLVNTWPVIHAALHDTFQDMGHTPWSMQEVIARVSHSLRDSFPALFGERWREAGDAYQRHYRARHLEKLHALEDAEDVLKHFRARGIPLLIVSNKKGDTLRREVAHLGWSGYFSAIIGADDAARDKPHPDPALLALCSLEMEPGPHIWFIGDSDLDLACAASAGCTPILFGPHAATHEEYSPTHYRNQPYTLHVTGHRLWLEEILQ